MAANYLLHSFLANSRLLCQATLRFGDQDAESYVNRVGGIGARFSGRYHCGLDRRAWICTDAPD